MDSGLRKAVFFGKTEKFYNSIGFKFRKSDTSFFKKDSQGNEFVISYEVWPSFMQIEPSYEILIKDVEDVKRKAWGKSYKKFCSIGRQRAYLLENPSDSTSWTDTIANVEVAINREKKEFYEIAEKYFSKYVDLSVLNEKLNSNLGENLDITYNEINGSFLGVIVAFLVKNNNLIEIINYYEAVINRINPNYNSDFNLLKKYIVNS